LITLTRPLALRGLRSRSAQKKCHDQALLIERRAPGRHASQDARLQSDRAGDTPDSKCKFHGQEKPLSEMSQT